MAVGRDSVSVGWLPLPDLNHDVFNLNPGKKVSAAWSIGSAGKTRVLMMQITQGITRKGSGPCRGRAPESCVSSRRTRMGECGVGFHQQVVMIAHQAIGMQHAGPGLPQTTLCGSVRMTKIVAAIKIVVSQWVTRTPPIKNIVVASIGNANSINPEWILIMKRMNLRNILSAALLDRSWQRTRWPRCKAAMARART